MTTSIDQAKQNKRNGMTPDNAHLCGCGRTHEVVPLDRVLALTGIQPHDL